VDSAGIIQQRPTYYTDEQLEETIIIGQLVHPSRTFINLARTNPNVAYATDKQYEQFIRSFGPIKVSGHTISPNGANLKLNRTSGTAFSLGRNWINDTDNPSVVSDPAQTDCIFYRYYRGATAGTFITVPNQTAIDPTKYDDGTGTLATVPGGKYTIQRIFYYPNTPTLLGVYYGRGEYTSLADAAANINFENFTEIENTKTNAIFVAYLLVKSGATDLTNTSDALILQAGNFRSTTSGGGSVSLTLDDLTDVIITSPQNYQVLTYVDGVTGWENLSVTSLPLVSSLRGLTGAVGITNGSGIGLSVSGNTLTVSNTGVLSIDGSTGAITNVARTNVNNNFSAPQTISASGAVFGIDDTLNSAGVTIDPVANDIIWRNGLNQSTLDFNPQGQVVTLPNITTTLAGLSGTQTFGGTKTFNALTNFNAGISASGATFSGNISAPNIVNSVRGITGAVGITNGSGIGLSVSGNTLTVSNTGVLSVNGSTGAITNVAKTNVDNNFSASQTIDAGGAFLEIIGSASGFKLEPGVGIIVSDMTNAPQTLQFNPATLVTTTVTLPNYTTTLAGLSGTQTFTGTNTFSSLANFNAGISSAGGTFSALTRFTAGISAAGATFSGDIAVNGGDITTTSTSASLFNANATTLDILNTQSSGFTLNIGTATTFSGSKNINLGTNISGGANSTINIGSANSLSRVSILGGVTLGGVAGANVVIPNSGGFISNATSTFNSNTSFNAGISAAGGITFNSNVTINSANTLNVTSIVSDTQLYLEDTSNARVSIGDYSGNNNSTLIYLRDPTYQLQLANPYGIIEIGDPYTIDTGAYIYYSAPEGTLHGNGSNINNFYLIENITNLYSVNIFGTNIFASAGISSAGGTFSALTRFTAGISASGATFSGPVNLTNTLLINGTQGSNNQVLTSTGSGITWATPAGGGSVTSVQGLTGDVILPAINFMLFNMGIV
jgi:hypothetical protein